MKKFAPTICLLAIAGSAQAQFTFDMTSGGSGSTTSATFQFDVVADTVVQTSIDPVGTNTLGISGSGGDFGATGSTGTFDITVTSLADDSGSNFDPVNWTGGTAGQFLTPSGSNGWGVSDTSGGISIGGGEAVIFEFDLTNLILDAGELLVVTSTVVRDTSANLNLQYRNIAGAATAPVQIIDGDTFGSGSSVSWVLNDRELLDGDQFAFWAEGSGTKTLKDWQFAIIPIPEPSAFGGIFGLSAIALVMRRRRVAK